MDKIQGAITVFDKAAAIYQEKFMDVSLYADTIDRFCGALNNPAAVILDVACGPGNITRYLLDKNMGYRILGIDLAPNMIKLAEANNPEAEFKLMDCREIASLEQKFDGIVLGFVLPYLDLEQTAKLLQDASGILNDGGALYISAMEGDYSKSGLQTGSTGDSVFVHYHEEEHLKEILYNNKLTILSTERREYPYNGSVVHDLILVTVKYKEG